MKILYATHALQWAAMLFVIWFVRANWGEGRKR